MNSISSSTKLLAAFLCGAALVGCNAVETTDPTPVYPNPATTVVINGEVSGLSTTRPVVLRVVTTTPANTGTSTPGNVTTSRTVSFRGTNVLRFGAVPTGSTYAITVDTQPYARNCTVANGTGTANADVANVTVTCVQTSIPRFTLTANIASALAAAPPAGFAITLTTEEGSETITPTAGQTAVTFTLPIFYPGSNPPTFDYRVTATNTVGGTINNCAVTQGFVQLGGGTGNITGSTAPTVTGCLYKVFAAVSYSPTPACATGTTATLPNTGCSPLIAAGTSSAIGAGLQLALRNQITGATVVQAPLVTTAGTVEFPGTYASNASALYEVFVQTHPAGQFCITAEAPANPTTFVRTPNASGGVVNLVNSLSNVTVQIRCRNVPATANQLKGVYQLNPNVVQEIAGATTVQVAGSTLPVPRVQKRAFLTFFPNGTFLMGTHPSAALAGVEHGFYNYNPVAGTLQFTLHTDTNGTTAATSTTVNSYESGLSSRVGYAPSFSVGVQVGAVTATNVVKTVGAPGVPGTLSMTFGAFSATPLVSPNTVINLNPTWAFTEPRHTPGQIQGAWTTDDSLRVFVFDDVTYYGFHAGMNGAPNLQDACFTIVDARVASSYYTRRGGGTGCMTTALGATPTTNGTVSVATVDVPELNTTYSTGPIIPGFKGRLPGSQSTLTLSTSPVNYTVTTGNPDTLVIQNTLNAIPIDEPITFKRATTY
jgi:hypothetical protein